MAHKHDVLDTDGRFVIDPKTRVITDVSAETPLIIQYDHNSERLTFELPRFIDGHDMLLCNLVEVHFKNVEYNKFHTAQGVHESNDLQVSADDDSKLTCSWLIPQDATRYNGDLFFSLRFVCVDGANLDYVWSTATYSSLKVSEGIYCGD